jgi:hypothetical protein
LALAGLAMTHVGGLGDGQNLSHQKSADVEAAPITKQPRFNKVLSEHS